MQTKPGDTQSASEVAFIAIEEGLVFNIVSYSSKHALVIITN
jgi:hypothetical protein